MLFYYYILYAAEYLSFFLLGFLVIFRHNFFVIKHESDANIVV